MGRFSSFIVERRKELGFKSPYAFYHNGTNETKIGCSYKFYLTVEQGKHLPRVDKLQSMLATLKLDKNDILLRSAVWSYLSDYFASGKLSEFFEMDSHDDEMLLSITEEMADKTFERVHIATQEEIRVILQSFAHFAAVFVFYMDRSRKSIDGGALSDILHLERDEIDRVCADLVKIGLLKVVREKTYKSVRGELSFAYLSSDDNLVMTRFEERLADEFSEEIFYSSASSPVSAERISQFITHLTRIDKSFWAFADNSGSNAAHTNMLTLKLNQFKLSK